MWWEEEEDAGGSWGKGGRGRMRGLHVRRMRVIRAMHSRHTHTLIHTPPPACQYHGQSRRVLDAAQANRCFSSAPNPVSSLLLSPLQPPRTALRLGAEAAHNVGKLGLQGRAADEEAVNVLLADEARRVGGLRACMWCGKWGTDV
jgi:hypothetical protein